MKFSTKQKARIDSEILKRVRTHPGVSRIALSSSLGIAPSTVGNYVGRLLTQGFLVESEKMDCEDGRPPTALQLNPDGGQFIGVDFEARSIMATAVDFSAYPLRQAGREIQKSDTVPEIIKKIEDVIIEILPEEHQHLLAIGVGVPGLVDPNKGIAIDYKYIDGWRNVPLAAPLAKRFGVPVYLENTIRSMALAELWFGQGKGLKDWMCIGSRSGLSAGIVAGGHLLRGASFQSGEIGRWRCPWPDRAAARFFAPKNSKITQDIELQEIASARAILAAWERARKSKKGSSPSAKQPQLSFADLVKAAQQGDVLTTQIIAVAAEAVGWAVSKLSLTLNPSHVILAGPLTQLHEIFLTPLRRRAHEELHSCGGDIPVIVNSSMGDYIGALGAAALAVHEWNPRSLRL